MVETLSKNITRQGLTATTLNYLRVSSSISSIEPVVGEEAGGPGGGPGGGSVAPPPLDPDSLPLPSAHTLTGQPLPSSSLDSMAPTMDFAPDSFQFQ